MDVGAYNDRYWLLDYDYNEASDHASYYFFISSERDCHHQTDLTLTERVMNSVHAWPK